MVSINYTSSNSGGKSVRAIFIDLNSSEVKALGLAPHRRYSIVVKNGAFRFANDDDGNRLHRKSKTDKFHIRVVGSVNPSKVENHPIWSLLNFPTPKSHIPFTPRTNRVRTARIVDGSVVIDSPAQVTSTRTLVSTIDVYSDGSTITRPA